SNEAGFPKEVSTLQQGDHGFFALLGDDGEFDLALLDIKHGIRRATLRKDYLFLPTLQDRFAAADFGEEGFGIERPGVFGCHQRVLPGADCIVVIRGTQEFSGLQVMTPMKETVGISELFDPYK